MDERAHRDRGSLRVSGYAQNLAGLVLAIGVVLMAVGVGLVGYQLTQPGGTVTVLLSDPAGMIEVEQDALPDGAALDVAGSLDEVDLRVDELPAWLRALTRAPMLIAGLLALVGAVLLRRVLLEVAAGRPFAPVVPGRLAGLALTVLAAGLLPQGVDSLATVAILEHLGAGGDSALGFTIVSLDLLPLTLAAGLGIAASVFRHGQWLTDEVEGLV